MQVSKGSMLIAAGILIAGLGGLCTLSALPLARAEAALALIIFACGGVPMFFGIFLILKGRDLKSPVNEALNEEETEQ